MSLLSSETGGWLYLSQLNPSSPDGRWSGVLVKKQLSRLCSPEVNQTQKFCQAVCKVPSDKHLSRLTLGTGNALRAMGLHGILWLTVPRGEKVLSLLSVLLAAREPEATPPGSKQVRHSLFTAVFLCACF